MLALMSFQAGSHVAALTSSSPRFLLSSSTQSCQVTPSLRTSSSGETLLEILPSVLAPLPITFRRIQQLTMIQDVIDTTGASKDKIVMFRLTRSSISHYLLSCWQEVSQIWRYLGYPALYEPLRIAGLLYMECVLATTRPNSAVLWGFGNNLKSALCRTLSRHLPHNWDRNPLSSKILLWIIFLGGLANSEVRDSLWHAAEVHHYMMVLGMKSWQELKSCLSELLWTEKMNDAAYEALWKQIQQLTVWRRKGGTKEVRVVRWWACNKS